MTDSYFGLASSLCCAASAVNYCGRRELPEETRPAIRRLVDELWRDLMRAGSLWSNIRLVYEGRDLHPNAFMTGRIGDGMIVHSSPNTDRIAQYLADGATLIYNHIHETSPAVQRIQEVLEYQLDARVWIQAYLTRTNESAFGPHVDDHNFIVLQLFGLKGWQVNFTGSDPNSSDSATLSAGEFVAIPSNTPHCVSGCGTLSLHLTIAFQWLDSTRSGSVIPLSDRQAHRSAARLGSAIPMVLHNDLSAFQLRFKFRDRVKPNIDRDERGLRINYAGGRALVDHCFYNILTELAEGQELTRDELLARNPGLAATDLERFLRFGVSNQILNCSG